MLHDTLSPESLQKVDMKEGEIPLPISPRTDTYINDTNKTTEDDKYPWLDIKNQEINKWKINFKEYIDKRPRSKSL